MNFNTDSFCDILPGCQTAAAYHAKPNLLQPRHTHGSHIPHPPRRLPIWSHEASAPLQLQDSRQRVLPLFTIRVLSTEAASSNFQNIRHRKANMWPVFCHNCSSDISMFCRYGVTDFSMRSIASTIEEMSSFHFDLTTHSATAHATEHPPTDYHHAA